MRNAKSTSIIEYLSKDVFPIFGVPETLYSDNGKSLVSKELEAFLSSYGIKHKKPPLYSPQSNASERVNRSLIAAIRAYIDDDHASWDSNLHHILAALRSGIHSATKVDPYYVVFGQHMIQHGSSYKLLKKLDTLGTSEIKTLSNADRQQIVRDKIKKNLQKAYERYAKTYNTRSKEVSFAEGQEIFRRNHILSDFSKNRNAKFCKKFVKGRIKKVLAFNRYKVEDLKGKTVGIYHAKDLRQ